MTTTAAVDTLDMLTSTLGLPEQVEAAGELGTGLDGLPHHDDIENVVVLGMGGSGIGGEIVSAVAGPFMPVPLTVVHGYEAPSFVGDSTLCFAVSFSGNTEETIEAATGAAAAGARMVVISTGGELERLAAAWGAPYVKLPDDLPMPRSAVGLTTIPQLRVLEQVGLFPGAAGWIAEAVAQLRRRRTQLSGDANAAVELARRIGRTMPLIYGGGELGLVAAHRWKFQVNENAKAPAFAADVPELTHNEICGWGQHGDMTRQVFSLVFLRHDHEHPQVGRRFELVREYMDEVVADIHEVRAEGEGALAQLFDLMYVGDLVSLHMSFQAGVDPGPVPILDDIKARVAQR